MRDGRKIESVPGTSDDDDDDDDVFGGFEGSGHSHFRPVRLHRWQVGKASSHLTRRVLLAESAYLRKRGWWYSLAGLAAFARLVMRFSLPRIVHDGCVLEYNNQKEVVFVPGG